MNIEVFEFNPVRENTYILFDETKEAVIIDAGCFFPEEKQSLLDFIKKENLKIKYLLNTHLHFDHILGNSFIKEQFGLETKANRADEFLLDTLPMQLQMFGFPSIGSTPSIGEYIKEGDEVVFGNNQRLSIIEVPGHSPGSIALYNALDRVVFTGDALFKSSIGRTDLPKGNHNELIKSIKEKLFTLPSETIVYPGHGAPTSIGIEKQTNPFLQ